MIRTCHQISFLFEHAPQGCHTCPADAHEVDVTEIFRDQIKLRGKSPPLFLLLILH